MKKTRQLWLKSESTAISENNQVASVIINPGSGPVANSSEDLAAENMKQFSIDCKAEGLSFKRVPEKDYGEGRFAFEITNGIRTYEIQMPGIHLDQVRYTGAADQNIWNFPRLYVDGSSWVWKFAVQDSPEDWMPEGSGETE